jgi:uncharacterized membrane protein YeaQ/YmgE (transglycosylase-associated protein family)
MVKSLLINSYVNKRKRCKKSLSKTDKLYALIFSEISLGVVIPILIGLLILAFPTVIYDLLANVKLNFPEAIWGGVEIPLQYILTIGTAQGILTCAIPIMIGLTWNRWAGGASGFLMSLLYTLSMGIYYGIPYGTAAFDPTVDWLGLIVSGMLAGYIAGSLMTRARMRGNDNFKNMLIASIVGAAVATVFTTLTYMWFAPMFNMGTDPYWDRVGLAWFTYVAIYGVWCILAAIGAKISTWFR